MSLWYNRKVADEKLYPTDISTTLLEKVELEFRVHNYGGGGLMATVC